MPRHIYIDLGANVGDTVAAYLRENPGCTAYAFEPNPKLVSRLQRRFANDPVRIMGCAAWILDGDIKMYLGHDLSGTVMEGKRFVEAAPHFHIDYRAWIIVRSLDMSAWMLTNFSNDDTIDMKIDVEGAEYKLLQSLADTGALDLVRNLRCEFHYDRFPVAEEEHRRIRALAASKTNLVDWY